MNDGAIEKTDLILGCVQTMRGTGCFEHMYLCTDTPISTRNYAVT